MIALRIPAFFIVGAIGLIFAPSAPAKPGLVTISMARKAAPPAPAKPSTAKSPAAKSSPAPSATPKSSADWQVIKVGARDYLSAENIAKFYGLLGNVDSTGKTVVLNNGRNQLQLTLESREAIVNGVRNWLCFPVIAQDDKFLVSRIDLAKTIEPQLRPQMIQPKGQVKTVVLDPGHGGSDKGARNPLGTEKEFALDVARKLRPLLQAKGFKVVLTRENDAFIPLHVRAHIANQTRDSIFVSIHFNGASNRDATGFEIFSLTPRGAPSTGDDALALHFVNMQAGSPVDAQSFGLSAAVYHSMLGHLAEFDRGIKRARFAVLRHTKIPAVLVEGGFLSETGDSKRVADPAWRAKFAEALSVGIENYRNVVEKRERPMLVAEYRAQDVGGITLLDLARPPAQLEPSPAPSAVPAATPEPAADREP
ncbi:MAG TPA: N-acetylmuramoyl-L-alanine amidase [Chthoniobacterales bacterium]|nr:N-acetylmuramoyl-L-alanine amidase [Chthoniobacterales bacterium]